MRKNHGKEDQENEKDYRTPSWLQGESQRDDLRDSNQNRDAKSRTVRPQSRSRRPLQHDRCIECGRRLANDTSRVDRSRKHDSRQGESGKTDILEGRTWALKYVKVSFSQIRAALTDADLHNLLSNTYISSKNVIIDLDPKLIRYAEDSYLPIATAPPTTKKIVKRKGNKPKKAIPPSQRYQTSISDWQTSGQGNAEVVLGLYFSLYKRFFHEEDPEWVGVSSHRAIVTIDQFVTEVADGNYRPVINYVRKILPLWVGQLKRGENFPENRPTIKALFCGTRYFWSNRNLLYKRWQER